VSVVAGLLLGDYLDRRLGSSPWLTLGLVLLGMAAGVFRVLKEFGSPNQKD
jgi:F0F1-type ATP synthase assembly protein I